MFIRFLGLLGIMLAGSAVASAQTAEPRVCTDLSGKFVLRCPHDRTHADTVPELNGEPTSTKEQGQRQTQPAMVPVTAPTTSVSMPAYPPGVANPASPSAVQSSSLERSLARDFISDQKSIWTSPLKLRLQDTQWLAPLVGALTVTALGDGSIEKELPSNPSFIRNSKSFSDYGAAGYAGLVAGGYLWSRATHNDHLRETAILSGEAALHSLLITSGVKYIAGRDRPLEGDRTGSFFHGGSSFPSLHSSGAWAIASVVAREYPGPLTKLFVYGGAAAISAARVTGRQHFISDAVVGSVIGWYIGRQVYNAHSDRESLDSTYGRFIRQADRQPAEPTQMGSPYVALDSWIYPAIERLAALGYIRTAFVGTRPWTRMECARLVEEAGAVVTTEQAGSAPASKLYEALAREFVFETRVWTGKANLGFQLESIYTRLTSISGTPLTDGFHFGQTIANDYGRPYQQGLNAVTGVSSSAVAGPFAFYFRGEYQHAPDAPALSFGARQFIANADRVPVPPGSPIDEVNRTRIIEAYAAVNIHNWQVSFGKQNLWWGPGNDTALMFTNNAEPITMLKVSRSNPLSMPRLSKLLGPVKSEFFIGRLNGHRFIYLAPQYSTRVGSYSQFLDDQPFIHGEKFTLRPTANLEIGVGLTAVFGGAGVPFTTQNLLRTFKDYSTGPFNNGDRKTGFQFSYRVPGLRNWLTLYTDSMAEDEPNPIAYPRRSAMNPGIYLSHVPYIPKLDLRVESIYTDLPNLLQYGMFYSDIRFVNSYTNNGNIMGSAVGRQGRGIHASSTYWVAPRKTIKLSYHNADVSSGYLPNGGSFNDVTGTIDWEVRKSMTVGALVQVERWNFPLLSSQNQTNVVAQFQFTYWPRWGVSKH